MTNYPFPKPIKLPDREGWVVQTESGEKLFTDPELAWSAYYFAKLNYERHGYPQSGQKCEDYEGEFRNNLPNHRGGES
jgi:hypothetical protein